MTKQPTRRRRARCVAARVIAVAGAAVALAAALAAGQALASTDPLDERVLERQVRVDRQADEQAKAALPLQLSTEDKAAVAQAERKRPRQPSVWNPNRFSKPEPKMDSGPWIDDQPVPHAPAPAGGLPDLVVPAAVAVLVLALGVATTWWVRHRRPPPEPTT
jgi:hypothetical protein